MRNNLAILIGFSLYFFLLSYLGANLFSCAGFGIDDANVFFTYARNLSEGNGLRYTLQEAPVEGVTSLLWTLILASYYLADVFSEELVRFMGVLFYLATIYLIYILSVELSKEDGHGPVHRKSLLFLPLILVPIPYLYIWTATTLMDAGLWVFLITLFFVVSLRYFGAGNSSFSKVCLLIPLLIITRPESYALVPLALIGFYFIQPVERRRLRELCILLTVYAGSMLLLTAFRLYYFDDYLPNTYYAKVSSDSLTNIRFSLIQLAKFLLVYSNLFVVLFIALFRLRGNGKVQYFIFFMLLCIASAVPTGADHFYGYRKYLILFPLIIGVILSSFHRAPRLMVAAFLFATCSLANYRLFKFDYSMMDNQFCIAKNGRLIGEILNEEFHELPSVAVDNCSTSYTYKGKVIDVFGLATREFARAKKGGAYIPGHSSFDIDTFFKLQPDIFLPTLTSKDVKVLSWQNAAWSNLVFKSIFSHQKFLKMYSQRYVDFDNGRLFFYMRNDHRDFLNGLDIPR